MIFSPLEQFTVFPTMIINNINVTFIFVLLLILFIKFIPQFLFQKHIE